MKGVSMRYTVNTMLKLGNTISEISRILHIDRQTVRKIRDEIAANNGEVVMPVMKKSSMLDAYDEFIKDCLSEGLSGVLIHSKLQSEKGLRVGYSTIRDYIRKFKVSKEVYLPLVAQAGSEMQVDFGYAGYFNKDGHRIKVWVFVATLSYSRYAYYELVENQSVNTFIKCHINAFEFFGGVPKTVKIDNLKAGVLKANFYEPQIQKQYADMLSFYGCLPIVCAPYYPQEKGKVESGVKYVKGNFLKSLQEKDFYQAQKLLKDWTNNTCNTRIHGSTRKIPKEVFLTSEKKSLKAITSRYELFDIQTRTVDKYSCIYYNYNHYSVPYRFVGKTLTIKTNGFLLSILDENFKEVALHTIDKGKGNFITNQAHIPEFKKLKTKQELKDSFAAIGSQALLFYENLANTNSKSSYRVALGILSLNKRYNQATLEAALKRANAYGIYSYLSVKRICENGLYELNDANGTSVIANGFANNLKLYDSIGASI